MNVLVLGPLVLNENILRWAHYIVSKARLYNWALIIPDTKGTSQMIALMCDAMDVNYTIIGQDENPVIISCAGNFEQDLYAKPEDLAYRDDFDFIVTLPDTPQIRLLMSRALVQNKLLVNLGK